MFCSKCGKTLAITDEKCSFCNEPVGESRFEGMPYTASQKHIYPNGVRREPAVATRTTFTAANASREEGGDVDSRTTYRPTYEGGSAPEEMRREMRAELEAENEPERPDRPEEAPRKAPERTITVDDLSDGALETLKALEEELRIDAPDVSSLRAAPIESTGRAGISESVQDYMRSIEEQQTRRAQRKRRRAEEAVEQEELSTPEDDQPMYDDVAPADPEQGEEFEDIDEDELEEMRYGRTLGVKDILKVTLIMVVAAALIVGGVMWFRHIRSTQSDARIEGVSSSLYESGLETIKAHAGQDYIREMVGVFGNDGPVAFAQRNTEDTNAIDALLPAEPAVNDSLFISALQTIQSNIGNAIYMDAQDAANGSVTAEADSAARWDIVNNSIVQLEVASSAAELTAILNGEIVSIATEPTPSPTPEPVNYSTLQKGDKTDAVLDLQNRLFELGFLTSDRDGDYGNKTQTAVKLFQSAAGITVTGIADAETQAAIYADDAPRTEFAQPTPEPVVEANTADADYAGETPEQAAATPEPEAQSDLLDDPVI